ncbi:MAG: hypothetical protein AB1489_25720 [Acidobacteriota bacterium]
MRTEKSKQIRYWRLIALTAALAALAAGILPKQFSVVEAATVIIDLSTTNAFDLAITGAQVDDMAGSALAIGDLNGDRVDDLIIGIPGSDGIGGQRLNSGEVRIFFGRSSLRGQIDLASGAGDVRLLGAAVNDFFGSNLAFVDINTDGVKDLVIAAPGFDGLRGSRDLSGALYVIFGGKQLNSSMIDFSSASPDLLVVGPRVGAQIGTSLAGGDFNRDNFEDLVIGAATLAINPGGPATGGVFVLIGFNINPPAVIDLNGSDRVAVTILGAANGDMFGNNVATGDFNRDGARDIIATAPGSTASGRTIAGSLHVFYGPFSNGSTVDLSKTSAGFTLLGPITNGRLGEGMVVGDVDADRIDDIVVTAPGATATGRPNAGQTFILYGSVPLVGIRDLGSMSADASFGGVNSGDQFGSGAALLLTDIDKDNFTDVIVGAPSATNPADRARNGQAFILLKGGTRFEQRDLQTKPADITILGPRALDRIGTRFALGDINADGKPDLAIAAPFSGGPQGNRSNTGMIFTVSNFNPNAPGNNQPPTLAVIDNQTVGETNTLNIDVTAVDPDSAITLSLIRPPTPSFVTLVDLGGGRGRITIAPPTGSIGSYVVTVRATDNGNPPLSAQRDFALTVTPPMPMIGNATFNGKVLLITGSRFGTSPRVLVNNTDVSARIKKVSDTSIMAKGKPKKLNIRAGDNTVQVIDANGVASNIFILKQ